MNKLPKQFFDGKVFLHQLCVPVCMNTRFINPCRRLDQSVGERGGQPDMKVGPKCWRERGST